MLEHLLQALSRHPGFLLASHSDMFVHISCPHVSGFWCWAGFSCAVGGGELQLLFGLTDFLSGNPSKGVKECSFCVEVWLVGMASKCPNGAVAVECPVLWLPTLSSGRLRSNLRPFAKSWHRCVAATADVARSRTEVKFLVFVTSWGNFDSTLERLWEVACQLSSEATSTAAFLLVLFTTSLCSDCSSQDQRS